VPGIPLPTTRVYSSVPFVRAKPQGRTKLPRLCNTTMISRVPCSLWNPRGRLLQNCLEHTGRPARPSVRGLLKAIFADRKKSRGSRQSRS